MRWFASGFGLVSANSRFIIHDGPIRGECTRVVWRSQRFPHINGANAQAAHMILPHPLCLLCGCAVFRCCSSNASKTPPVQRSCSFISPSLWEGRPASGRGGLRAGSDARPSPRFARPSQGEGDDKRLATQQLKTARPLQREGSESERSVRFPG